MKKGNFMKKRRLLMPVVLLGLLLGACQNDSKSTSPVSSEETPVSQNVSVSSEATSNSSFDNPSSTSSNAPSTSKGEDKSSSNIPSSSITPSSSSQDKTIAVSINNMSSKMCEIYDATQRGIPYDEGEFKVRMINDYTFKSISATDSGGDNVELVLENGIYYFTIPADGKLNVLVRGNAPVQKQKLYVSDVNRVLTADPAYVRMSGPEYLTDYVQGEGEPYWKIDFNSKIRFSFPDPTDYKNIGLTFNGTTYNPTKEKRNIDLDFNGITGDLHVTVFGQKQTTELHGVGTDHLTVSFMNSSKSEAITEASIGQSYYVVITSLDKENYLVDKLTYSYKYKNSETERTDHIESSLTETTTGWEILRTAPNSAVDENGITYTVTEDNLIKFIDEEWCGNYACFATFTYTEKEYNTSELSLMTINGAGKASAFNRELKITATSVNPDNGITYLNDREVATVNSLWYKNGILVAGYGQGSNNLTNPFYTSASNSLSDDIYAFKMIADTSLSDYSLRASAFTIAGKTYVISLVYYQNVFYKGFYTARSKNNQKEFEFGITIDMIYGSYFNDLQSIYTVKDLEGNVVETFTFSGQGGNKNRTLLPEYGGIYSYETNTLVLCEGVAIYNGNFYVASLPNKDAPNEFTLNNAYSQIVITINKTNMTFSVQSNNTQTLTLSTELAGKKFRKQWNDGDGIRYSDKQTIIDFDPAYDKDGYYVEFDSTNPTLNCVCDNCWLMTMTKNNANAYGKTYNAQYYWDSASKTATAMVFGFNNEYCIIHFVYNNGKLSFYADELSNGRGYYINDLVEMLEVAE